MKTRTRARLSAVIVSAIGAGLVVGAVGLWGAGAARGWWRDNLTLSQLEVFGGLAGAALALVALAYAKLVADEQGEIINKQLGILEDHKAILLRLEASEKQQESLLSALNAVAQVQQEVAHRQADLAVFARYVVHPELSEKNGVATHPFGPEETPDEASS